MYACHIINGFTPGLPGKRLIVSRRVSHGCEESVNRCGWGATPFFPLKSREQFTKQPHHSVFPADSSLGGWNRRARPVKGAIRKRARGCVCDRRIHVTNVPPRPSCFVQTTVRSFRVYVPAAQRARTTCVAEPAGGRRLGRDTSGGLP